MTRAEILVRQLGNLPPGSHVCPMYRSPDDRHSLLVPYFQAGVAEGEQCLYIADETSVDRLRAQVFGGAEDVAPGALMTLTARESYLRGGHFDPERMVEFWTERLAAARAAGYVGLRVTGEMNWALGSDIAAELLLEYETALNQLLPSTGIRAMCLYDWNRTKPSMLREVLRAHPLAIIDLRLHDNPFYEPPQLELGHGDPESARLNWMITQLQTPTRRDTALVDLGHLALDSALADLIRAAEVLVTTELGVEYVEIFELLASGNAVRRIGTTGPDMSTIGRVERLPPDHPLASTSPRSDGPLIVSDWRHETRFTLPAALRDAGVTSSISIAISVKAGQPMYGMLTVHSRHGRIFTDDECLFLESIGIFLAYGMAGARSESSLRALVENASDIIVRFDGDLRVAYVNPAIERVIGTAAESLVGKSSLDLGVLESQLPAWELTLHQVWRTGREQKFELTLRSLLGEHVLDIRIVPEFGSDGEVQSLLSISRDITAQRTGEVERSALYRQLVAQQNQVQELVERLGVDRERARGESVAAALVTLTERERRILRLLAAGRTNREIAADIGITPGTTKNQVAQILSKLNVTNRTAAAARAVELGVVVPVSA